MAHAALCGIDPLLFFKTEDETEMAALRLVAMRAIKVAKQYREDQANFIIAKLSKAMGGGRRGSSGQNSSSTRS